MQSSGARNTAAVLHRVCATVPSHGDSSLGSGRVRLDSVSASSREVTMLILVRSDSTAAR